MAYLVHFNKLHSKSNGQFISGDGDGDGTADEHHRYTTDGRSVSTNSGSESQQLPQGITSKEVKALCTVTRMTAGKLLVNAALNKIFYKGFARDFRNTKRYISKNTGITKAMKTSNWKNFKNQKKANLENKAYEKAAETINKKLIY